MYVCECKVYVIDEDSTDKRLMRGISKNGDNPIEIKRGVYHNGDKEMTE